MLSAPALMGEEKEGVGVRGLATNPKTRPKKCTLCLPVTSFPTVLLTYFAGFFLAKNDLEDTKYL